MKDKPLFQQVDRCLFCDKKKTWRSNITIEDKLNKHFLAEVTVCPKCRENHLIADIYLTATMKTIEGIKKQ